MKKPLRRFQNSTPKRKKGPSGRVSPNDTTEYFDWGKARVVQFVNLRASTKTISLRLPENLLDRIRVQANKYDVPYQSLMKVWLAEKVEEVSSQAVK